MWYYSIIAAQEDNVTFVVTPPHQRHVRNTCHIQMLYTHTCGWSVWARDCYTSVSRLPPHDCFLHAASERTDSYSVQELVFAALHDRSSMQGSNSEKRIHLIQEIYSARNQQTQGVHGRSCICLHKCCNCLIQSWNNFLWLPPRLNHGMISPMINHGRCASQL